MTFYSRRRLVKVFCVAIALVVASACAKTRQPRSQPTPQGFLGDYSQLRKGEGAEAQLRYVNSTADFSQYDAVWIDTVRVWQSETTAKLSTEDQQMLTDTFYAALHEKLSENFRIADAAGPGVMRLRVAITEAEGANVAGNAVTTVVPQLRILTTAGGLATDTAVVVGKAGAEADLTDSQTGERLLAAVDQQIGQKTLRTLGKWSHVKGAFDGWAERLRERLVELQGRG